ncbi:MAG: hypothetical protein QNI94_07195 [Kiloniellales bacterium]|nr:hypothetical protein [Kiloniellales bacterium]
MYRVFNGLWLAIAIFALGGGQAAMAAEEQKVEAASAWISQGRYFQTGATEAIFIGVMAGTLYVKDAEGRLDTADILCPGDFVIDLESGAQEGEGKCIITDSEGENVFANWTCKGDDFLGCEGDFKLTAGTGKFEGITGGSPLQARTAFSEFVVNLKSGAVVESSSGLLTLPELTYTLP